MNNHQVPAPSPAVLPRWDGGSPSGARATGVPPTAKPSPPRSPAPTPRSWPKPSAAASPPNTSSASWPKPTRPRAPAASAPCSAAKACTPRCWPPGAASAQAGVLQALTPQKRGPKSRRDPLAEENRTIAPREPAPHRATAQSRDRHRCSKKSGRAVGSPDPDGRPGGEALMDAVLRLSPTVGIESACDALGVARASFYRQRPLLGPPPWPAPLPLNVARPTPARALSSDERQSVRDMLNSERFQDAHPPLSRPRCSMKANTIARPAPCIGCWRQDGATRERRDQLVHPAYQKPELLATAPNQLSRYRGLRSLGANGL